MSDTLGHAARSSTATTDSAGWQASHPTVLRPTWRDAAYHHDQRLGDLLEHAAETHPQAAESVDRGHCLAYVFAPLLSAPRVLEPVVPRRKPVVSLPSW